LQFILISILCQGVLSLLLIIEFLQVTLHYDLLLGLIQGLESLLEETLMLFFIFFFHRGDLHGWAVISNLASYLNKTAI